MSGSIFFRLTPEDEEAEEGEEGPGSVDCRAIWRGDRGFVSRKEAAESGRSGFLEGGLAEGAGNLVGDDGVLVGE